MHYYYTITSLPSLPGPGQSPTLSPAELIEKVHGHPAAVHMLLAVFERTALQREFPLDETRWFSYLTALEQLGITLKCSFLHRFSQFELGLAFAFEQIRLHRTPSLGPIAKQNREMSPDPTDDVMRIVTSWAETDDPVAGHRILLNGRRDWVARNGEWYSFNIDEIIAYGAALVIAIESAVLEQTMPLAAMTFATPVTRWDWKEAAVL